MSRVTPCWRSAEIMTDAPRSLKLPVGANHSSLKRAQLPWMLDERGAALAHRHRFGDGKETQKNRKIVYFGLPAIRVLAGAGYLWWRNHPPASNLPMSERLLTHTPNNQGVTAASLSRDGRYASYLDDKGVHILNLETGEEHELVLPEDFRKRARGVSWFPDGEKLLVSARSDNEGTTVWVTSIIGGTPRKLRAHCGSAHLSKDGKQIAFATGKGMELWTMGSNGENARKIQTVEGGYIFALEWSPTGKRIAYAVEEPNGAGVTVKSVGVDGGDPC